MNLTRLTLLGFAWGLLLQTVPAQTTVAPPPEPISPAAAKGMFDEADGYLRARMAELEKQKRKPDPKQLEKFREDQKTLAAKYVKEMQATGPQASDNLYYLGRLQQLAGTENAALESLRLFLVMNPENALSEVARPVAISCALSNNLVSEAEELLQDYERKNKSDFVERVGIEQRFSSVYRKATDFDNMASHAKAMYKIVKQAMNDKKCKPGQCEPLLVDSVGLVSEAYFKQNRPDESLAVLQRLQRFALNRPSVYLFQLATERLVRFNPAIDPFHIFDEPHDGSQKLPELKTVEWIDMQPAKLADLRGRVVLLDFWATWCGPCRTAFPELRKWNSTYKAKGLTIIGVTRFFGQIDGKKSPRDQELAYLRDFKKTNELPYAFAVADSDDDIFNYGVFGIPTYVLIDRAGNIRVLGIGAGSGSASMDKMIKKLIDEPPPAPETSNR